MITRESNIAADRQALSAQYSEVSHAGIDAFDRRGWRRLLPQ